MVVCWSNLFFFVLPGSLVLLLVYGNCALLPIFGMYSSGTVTPSPKGHFSLQPTNEFLLLGIVELRKPVVENGVVEFGFLAQKVRNAVGKL